MRWILALIVLAGGAWYLVNRRRRAGRQEAIQYEMPTEPRTQPANATATPPDSKEQAQTAGSEAPSMAAAAAGAISEQATEVVQKAADAAGSVQQAASAVAGRGEQAAVESAPAAGADTATADGPEAAAPGPTADESDTPRPVGAPIGAPDAPDEEVQVVGMEQAPEIDREEVLQRTSGEFIGNKSTRVFHAASANNLPAEDNRVYFDSQEEALAAGFRPAAREGLESAES